MAKITEVVVAASARVRLADYEHVDFFISAKVELSPEEAKAALGAEKAARQTRMRLEDLLADDVRRSFIKRGKTITTAQVRKRYGLPGFGSDFG